MPGVETPCAAASCSSGIAHAATACDTLGACGAQTATPCAPYACGVAACNTSCATAAECAPGALCNGASCALPPDAGVDAGADASADVAVPDAGTDVAIVDAGADVSVVDATADVAVVDAGADVAVVDAGADVTVQDVMVVDANADVAVQDASVDASPATATSAPDFYVGGGGCQCSMRPRAPFANAGLLLFGLGLVRFASSRRRRTRRLEG
jgi:hypothetical protein